MCVNNVPPRAWDPSTIHFWTTYPSWKSDVLFQSLSRSSHRITLNSHQIMWRKILTLAMLHKSHQSNKTYIIYWVFSPLEFRFCKTWVRWFCRVNDDTDSRQKLNQSKRHFDDHRECTHRYAKHGHDASSPTTIDASNVLSAVMHV